MSIVIKASGPVRTIDGAPFNYADVGDRAQAYLDQVRKQAAEILIQAQEDAAQIRAEAQEQGRAAALEAARCVLEEKMSRQLTTLLPALRDAIDRIHGSRAEWLTHWERIGVHVAAAIAGRVIRREVSRTPEITLALVKEALELAAGNGAIQLRMHPDDLAALGDRVTTLAAELARLGTPEVVADSQITIGSCRVDTRFGVIDQQFEAQLALVAFHVRRAAQRQIAHPIQAEAIGIRHGVLASSRPAGVIGRVVFDQLGSEVCR